MHWIVIYLGDSVVHLLNKRAWCIIGTSELHGGGSPAVDLHPVPRRESGNILVALIVRYQEKRRHD